jgi:mono/diheme cytochrome c family protein
MIKNCGKKFLASLGLGFAMGLLLSACGGSNEPGNGAAAPQRQAAAARTGSALTVGQVALDYRDVVERVYLAYFGRPADPGGLAFFEDVFLQIKAPTTIGQVSRAYYSNAALKYTIDSFATSKESQELHSGDNDAFITAIYHNLFGREPDAGGKAFWVGLLANGQMTRAQAAVELMAAAGGSDIDVISKKNAAGTAFTLGLLSPLQKKGYEGNGPSQVARTMLANVNLATDLTLYQTTVDATIASLATAAGNASFAQVQQIIQARCVSCHSATPTQSGFSFAPRGIKYDSATQIHAGAAQIVAVAAKSEIMPWANLTNMSADERSLLSAWSALGAP